MRRDEDADASDEWSRRRVLRVTGGVAVTALCTRSATAQSDGATEITDWTDLAAIRDGLDGEYVLVTDLDETTAGYDSVAAATVNGGSGFVPIGDRGRGPTAFTGVFDGQNHTIAGLTIDRRNSGASGLFGATGGAATIKNLDIEDADVTGGPAVGGVVGLNRGEIRNVSVSASVSGISPAGGLAGFSGPDSRIADSLFEGSVSADSPSGGFQTTGIGGLVGDPSVVIAFAPDGGVTVTNSHYNVDAVELNGEHFVTVGGIFDSQYQDWLANDRDLTPSEYDSLSTGDDAVRIDSLQGVRDALAFLSDPSLDWQITSDIDLRRADDSLHLPYLAGDLDGTGQTVTVDLSVPFPEQTVATGFVGINLNTVENIHISGRVSGGSRTGGLVGLNHGTVRDASAEVTVDGRRFTGGLIGLSTDRTEVRDAYVTGTVNPDLSPEDFDGPERDTVGGLIGRSTGAIANSAAETVVTGNRGVGGLVGKFFSNPSAAQIVESHASGEVSGKFGVGGLVGEVMSDASESMVSIDNTYSTADVSGRTQVGGLIGKIKNSDVEVTRSYAAGGVEFIPYPAGTGAGRNEYKGGLLGVTFDRKGVVLKDCYWDTEGTGEDDPVGSVLKAVGPVDVVSVDTARAIENVTGLATAEMQGAGARAQLTALDFEDTWTVMAASVDYPALRNSKRGITVPDVVARFDRDGDRELSIDELARAAQAFARGDLSRQQLSTVVDQYRR